MKIAEAARRSGLPVKTIRYYDDIRLIAPDRQENGYRDISEGCLQELEFLKRARKSGFTIEECRTLLTLNRDKDRRSADVKVLTAQLISRLDEQLAELQAMRSNLAATHSQCAGDDGPECAILDTLIGRG